MGLPRVAVIGTGGAMASVGKTLDCDGPVAEHHDSRASTYCDARMEMNDSRIVPVFQALAEDVHALGVRAVFGLMSDDTAVFAALPRDAQAPGRKVGVPDVDFASVAEAFGFQAYTIRTLDELRALGSVRHQEASGDTT
jgi:hypothetical protein